MTSHSLLSAACHVYAAAATLYLIYLFRPNAKLALAAFVSTVGGFALHVGVVAVRWQELGHVPLGTLSEGLSLLAALQVGIFLVIDRKYRLPMIGAFVTPLALAVLVPALIWGETPAPLPEALKLTGLPFHIGVAFGGIAAFATASAVGVMYLLMERQVKQKQFGMLFSRLPSLEQLDHINFALVRWGFAALTVTLVTGAFFAREAWGGWWRWDPKPAITLVGWLLTAALLHARMFVGVRGRKAAVLTMLSFLLLFGSFIGLRMLPTGLHTGDFQ